MSDDACWCEYEPPAFVSQVTRKARKEHRCDECARSIAPGEPYEDTFGKWDGIINRFKMCARCLEIRRFVTDSVPCFCWAYGNLHDDAQSTAEEYAHEAPGLLFGTYRRLIVARRAPRYGERNEAQQDRPAGPDGHDAGAGRV